MAAEVIHKFEARHLGMPRPGSQLVEGGAEEPLSLEARTMVDET